LDKVNISFIYGFGGEGEKQQIRHVQCDDLFPILEFAQPTQRFFLEKTVRAALLQSDKKTRGGIIYVQEDEDNL